MKYALPLLWVLLAACAAPQKTTQRTDGHQHHHEHDHQHAGHTHSLFESWRLAKVHCCGRTARTTFPAEQTTLSLKADSTYLRETTTMLQAELQTGQVFFQQKEESNYLRLGLEGQWAIYQIVGDTLILDYSYMDLAKEYYVPTEAHDH